MTRLATPLRFWITGGGTREPIDAVRWIGNVSTGRMALGLARTAAARGHAVTLFLAQHVVAPRSPRIDVVRFESSAQLRTALLAAQPAPDAILHAAAVSDYAPRPLRGKFASGQGGWRLELRPLKKIAPALRRRYPRAAFVLFKLESKIAPAELFSRAIKTARNAGADGIFANLLEEVGAEHRGWWVDPRDGATELAPSRAAAARLLVRRCEAIAAQRALRSVGPPPRNLLRRSSR